MRNTYSHSKNSQSWYCEIFMRFFSPQNKERNCLMKLFVLKAFNEKKKSLYSFSCDFSSRQKSAFNQINYKLSARVSLIKISCWGFTQEDWDFRGKDFIKWKERKIAMRKSEESPLITHLLKGFCVGDVKSMQQPHQIICYLLTLRFKHWVWLWNLQDIWVSLKQQHQKGRTKLTQMFHLKYW